VFARLCKAMGQAELAGDTRFATHHDRGANMAELDEMIAAWTSGVGCEEVLSMLDEHGVPAGRIFTAPDMLRDPQYLAREMIRRVTSAQGWEVPMTGVVPRFTDTPGAIRHPGPVLGEHTEEVLTELLGTSATEIDDLRATGVIGVAR
jgi:crotonobetainyl-CoA:carnitine CoA-transferase CaiB-like acyl-CoA transferase